MSCVSPWQQKHVLSGGFTKTSDKMPGHALKEHYLQKITVKLGLLYKSLQSQRNRQMRCSKTKAKEQRVDEVGEPSQCSAVLWNRSNPSSEPGEAPGRVWLKPKHVKLQRGEPNKEKDAGNYDHYKGWEGKRAHTGNKYWGFSFSSQYLLSGVQTQALNNSWIFPFLLCWKRKPKVCSVSLVYWISIPLCCCVLWTTTVLLVPRFFSRHFSLLN